MQHCRWRGKAISSVGQMVAFGGNCPPALPYVQGLGPTQSQGVVRDLRVSAVEFVDVEKFARFLNFPIFNGML